MLSLSGAIIATLLEKAAHCFHFQPDTHIAEPFLPESTTDQRATAAIFGAVALTIAGLRRTPRFHGIATISVALVAITDASQRRSFFIASSLQSPA
jgi:hypothetical protein